MTKAGKGRPDPKKRYGQKMKVMKNFTKKSDMTFEKFKKLMDRLNKSDRKIIKGTVNDREMNFFKKFAK